MILSKRLETVAGLVSPGFSVADVGTDHGYVPIFLAEKGICPMAIAMDINEGPLLRAQEHIREYGMQEQITCRLSDGLKGLEPGEVQSIVIAGMGGILIRRILADRPETAREAKELILSPHTDAALVRRYVLQNGFSITEERFVFDEGKYYPVIKASFVRQEDFAAGYGAEEDFAFGRYLIEHKDAVLKQYLESENRKFDAILKNLSGQESTENVISGMEEIRKKKAVIQAALRRINDEMQ